MDTTVPNWAPADRESSNSNQDVCDKISRNPKYSTIANTVYEVEISLWLFKPRETALAAEKCELGPSCLSCENLQFLKIKIFR